MPRRFQLFSRALRLRCPHCGAGGAFRHWFAMRDACASCGLPLAAGNRVGANLLNLVAAEVVVVVTIGIVVARSWPNPPWTLLQYGAPSLALLAPLLLYPFSKLIFVAMDLSMHSEGIPDSMRKKP